jgi:type I restriction enzyme S subunit
MSRSRNVISHTIAATITADEIFKVHDWQGSVTLPFILQLSWYKSHYGQLPPGWTCVAFATISINRDGERKPVAAKERRGRDRIYDYYGASGIIDKIESYLFDERLLLIGEDGANLLARSKPIAFFAEGKYWVNNHAHVIDSTDKAILDWLCIYINAISLDEYVTGSAQPKMTQDKLNSIPILLPPLAEQHRIIAAIESAFAVIDEIERSKTDLQSAVTAAKSKILSLAIRGKLVPQDPADEPASVLLERIRTEREALIKAGKIKRSKGENATPITRDNSYYLNIAEDAPFDVPDSWAWVHFGSICNYGSCNSIAAERIDSDAWVLDLEDIEKDTANILRFTTKRERPFTSAKHSFAKGKVLFSKLRPYLRKVVVAPHDGYCTSEILPLSFGIDICPDYVQMFLTSEYFISYTNLYACGAKMPRLGATDAKKALFALPPLAEQRRIVASTKSAFERLDAILATLA